MLKDFRSDRLIKKKCTLIWRVRIAALQGVDSGDDTMTAPQSKRRMQLHRETPQAQPATAEVLTPVEPTAFLTEQDLAMYAAITGRRPVVEVTAQPQPSLSIGHLHMPRPAQKGLRRVLATMNRHPKITVWIRHLSVKAKERISEAKYRLAG